VIELCDHYEFYSDNNEGQQDNSSGDEAKNRPFEDFDIPADDTQGGYQSGPENLEHSSIQPMLVDN